MKNTESFALIGASKTGISLAYHLKKAGLIPEFIWNRGQTGNINAGKYVNFRQTSIDLHKIPQNLDWIIIAVSDNAIREVAFQMSKMMKGDKDTKVFHLSGAWDSGLLDDLKSGKVRTGSFHPLLSIPDVETGIKMMQNTTFSCEGDIAAELQALTEKIGGTGIVLNPEQKSLVHLWAVFVNNFPTITIQAIKQFAESKGISNEMLASLLKNLSQQAIDNAWPKSITESLTGPVIRGDQNTIDRHLELLNDHRELKDIYNLYIGLAQKLLNKETE